MAELEKFKLSSLSWDGDKNEDEFYEHFGETRAQRIMEFHQHNDRLVLGLWEGAFLRWEDDSGHLIGGDATVFRPGTGPVTYPAGTEFGLDLVTRPY